MKQKLKNSIKLGIVILCITLCFTNCEANKDIIEESDLEHQIPTVLSEKISFTQAKHYSEINNEIKSIQTKFNKKQTSKENQRETGSLKILTDEVLYVTYAGTHTYTFKVARKNPVYLLENIVLHYNLRTKSYEEYLIQYKDLKEQDIKEISEGKLFQDSKKVIVTKLENGFFESHSSSNKGSSTSKADDVICTTATSTVWVDCSQGVHNQGNIEDWYKCTAKVGPSAYQSTSTTCKVSGPLTVALVEPSPSTGGGGGYDPDFVFYNPLPLELCSDSADVVDLNGNCLQQIDVAVSYIANCLSSSYSTTLSQNEISYLYSTTSSFGIKSYLENSGCSSESIAFVKEIINYMRTNTLNSDSETTELFFKALGATNNFQDNLTESFVQDNISYFSEDVQNQILIDPLLAVQIAQEYLIQRAVKKYLHRNWNEVQIYYSVLWDLRHMTLDAFGLIPVIGEVADLVNGTLYTIEGDNVNAAFSFASAVPVAGWAAVGVKYAVKIKTVATIGTKVKLTWKVLIDGTIYFGTNNTCRAQLRKVLGLAVGNLNIAHHIIPLNLQTNTIVQKAFKSPDAFHLNEALNGIPLSRAVHNGSHFEYDKIIKRYLDAVPTNASPKECYDAVESIINRVRIEIKNNPNTPINQLIF